MERLNVYKICNFCQKYHSAAVKKFIQRRFFSKSELLKKHQSFKKRPRGMDSVYLLNKQFTDKVAQAIKNGQSPETNTILELNSGPGILVASLIDCTDCKIICTEKRDEFHPYLQKLNSDNPERISVTSWDLFGPLFKTSPTSIVNKYFEGEREVLSAIPSKKWTEAPPVTVVGTVLPNKWYFCVNYMIKHLAVRDGLYSIGRTEWFLFIPSRGLKWYLSTIENRTVGSFYTTHGILLSLLFDMKHHFTLPGEAFDPAYPLDKTFSEKTARGISVKRDDVHLLQFTPKIESSLKGDDIIKFQIFLQQLRLKGKQHRLIPKMEQWIPGIGIPLINTGYTMMQKMCDLYPKQLVEIYKEVMKSPDFENSGLQEMFEDSVSHLHNNADDEDSTVELTEHTFIVDDRHDHFETDPTSYSDTSEKQ